MARLPQTGVARLVDAAARFAARQPALAGLLGTTSPDPDLERVREGLFFLGASVTDQIHRFERDGYGALADIAAADLGRPFPAASIVELSVTGQDVTRVEDGAEVHVRGAPQQRFRVVGGLDVGPVRIENCRIESDRRISLRFDLVAAREPPLSHCIGPRLRLFLDEPRDTALLLLAHILEHTRRVELRRPNGETLPLEGINPRGFTTGESLAPEPDGVGMGSSLVREYFLLPERFLLLDLLGVAGALHTTDDRRATIILRFDAPLPQRVLVSPEGIRAHCAPVINVFPATGEPRVFEPGRTEFSVRVAGLPRAEAAPYAILGVTSSRLAGDGDAVSVPPLRRFGAANLAPSFPYIYATKVRERNDPSGPDTVVVLATPPDTLPILEPHAISFELLATNGHAGARVRPGELSEPGPGMPPSVRARNLVATSPFVPALTGPAYALRALVRAQVPRADPRHVIQTLLYSLIPDHAIDVEAGRALRARIRAVEQLDVDVTHNGPRTRRGYRARLTIDETPFIGLGDVALFARVVCHLLESRASLNRFFTCEVACTKSGARWTWPPGGPS